MSDDPMYFMDKAIYSMDKVVGKCNNVCANMELALLYHIPGPVPFPENNVLIKRNTGFNVFNSCK